MSRSLSSAVKITSEWRLRSFRCANTQPFFLRNDLGPFLRGLSLLNGFSRQSLEKRAFFPFHMDSSWKCGDGAQPEVKSSVYGWREGVFQCSPLSCLMSLPSVMVKSWAERGYDESSSGCRARTLWSFVCGFLCADFCARIFGADFCVRIFRCGFFGADFSVRIFRCGFFRCGFWCGFLGGFFSGFFFCKETAGRATKKIQQKIHQKILPKILPKISSPKILPKILPKSLSGYSQSVLTWTQRRCGCTPWCLCGGWLPKSSPSGNRWQWLTQASRLVLKTAKPPKIVVCIRPSTWEAWCTLQVTTLAYRHLSGAGCLSGLASFNLAKPEKTQKNPHRSSADPRRVTFS